MKYVVEWVGTGTQRPGGNKREAIEITKKKLCNSPNAELYGSTGFKESRKDTKRINEE